MTKLHQIVALESGEKTRLERERTEVYKRMQKPALFEGRVRTYSPSEDEGETFPEERQEVVLTATEAISAFRASTVALLDITATKDFANTEARADVVVDGQVLIPQAPVPYLLFLEKQLEHLDTFVRHIPTLDRGRRWMFDENTGLYEGAPEVRNSTRKQARAIVLYDATPEHPAQTQLITEDIVQGTWTEVKFNGGVPETEKARLLERVATLRKAVKLARCAANEVDAQSVEVGDKIFSYVFD